MSTCSAKSSISEQCFLAVQRWPPSGLRNEDQLIKSEYEFLTPIFRREKISDVVQRVGRVDVFAASAYIWSANYVLALAKAIKEANPNCLVVLGGPHVPVESKDYFHLHPYADLLVHYEGEQTFHEVLLARCGSDSREYHQIAGLTCTNFNGEVVKTPPRERINDLDEIPSPYLTGVFDELMKLPYDFHASQEVARGCPFQLSFLRLGKQYFRQAQAA